jgi:hypothetical protein
LSRVIVYKPTDKITIKKYLFTNGSLKTNFVSFRIKTNNYITTYNLPEGYEVTVIEYS